MTLDVNGLKLPQAGKSYFVKSANITEPALDYFILSETEKNAIEIGGNTAKNGDILLIALNIGTSIVSSG